MKIVLRAEARRLRKQGWSQSEIRAKLPVSKGTISLWVRDIPLTEVQKLRLQKKVSIAASRWAGAASHARAQQRYARWIKEAAASFATLSHDPIFAFGLGLYAGEGTKSGRACVVTNANPELIRAAMQFFELIGISRAELKFRVHAFPDIPVDEVKQFWYAQVGLTPTLLKAVRSKRSKQVRKPLRTGTAQIGVYSVRYLTQVLWWIQHALKSGR